MPLPIVEGSVCGTPKPWQMIDGRYQLQLFLRDEERKIVLVRWRRFPKAAEGLKRGDRIALIGMWHHGVFFARQVAPPLDVFF